MVYSEVINDKNLFLERKEKYTMRDVNALAINSLFKPYKGRTLSKPEAKFICRCWAIHYDTTYSKMVAKDTTDKIQIG